MERVIVGFDGSADAQAALRWAIRYGGTNDAPVVAHLVWTAEACPPAVLRRVEHPDDATMRTAAEQVLHEAVTAEGSRPAAGVEGARVEERVTNGDPAAALLGASGPTDLLVIGRHGAARRRHILTGSVAAECLHHASAPLVVIQADRPGTAGGPVVVGVDGSPGSITALRWAADHARRRDAVLRVVLAWSPSPAAAASLYTALEYGALRDAAQAVLDSTLDLAIQDIDYVKIERIVAPGDASHCLLSAADDAQLLVVGARGQGGFARLLLGSTALRCVHHAVCPTAVIHDEKA
jgi:nucleotide-binding universal stress UspA family protein